MADTAPYRFVPLDQVVLPSPLSSPETPSFDDPRDDGLCGRLTVRWEAETPLLIGGSGEVGNGSFFRLRDAKGRDVPAIPGSSLRGMLRSVLEIATLARMEHVYDKAHFGTRNFKDPRWVDVMAGRKRQYGWLLPPARARATSLKGWRLQPCKAAKVRTNELQKYLGNYGNGSVVERHEELARRRVSTTIRFRLVEHLDPDKNLAVPDKAGPDDGQVVFSGKDPSGKKASEMVFWGKEGEAFDVPEAVMDRFDFMNTAFVRGGTWDFWRLGNAERIPVFFVGKIPAEPEEVEKLAPGDFIMALSRLMKAPFDCSVGDLAKRADDFDGLDFVQALFGHAPRTNAPDPKKPKTLAWKSRVRFHHAWITAEPPAPKTILGITMAPRASFWPYYLRGGKATTAKASGTPDYSNVNSRIAGWKRYPARDGTASFPQPADDGGGESMRSTMRFLPASTEAPIAFEGEIRFHNLSPVEFGALIWAIGFGAPDGDGTAVRHRHMLGRGKPQGHGQMRARIVGQRIEPNVGGQAELLARYVERFRAWVLETYRTKSPEKPDSFEAIDAVASLLTMADPAIGQRHAGELTYPVAPTTGGESPSLAGYKQARERAAAAPNRPYPLPYPRSPG